LFGNSFISFGQKIFYIPAGFDQNFVFRTQHISFRCIIRLHCLYSAHTAQTWPFATDVACSVICLSVCVCASVCLCAGHTDVPWQNGWTNRDAVWTADSCGYKATCIRWGSRSHVGRDRLGMSGSLISTGSLCCSV